MYRAYYAIPRTLQTSRKEQVNAVFGVASMIINILNSEKPDGLLFCFDAGEETFRHKEMEEYKAGRTETPDDFYDQIPRILECVEAFSFRHVSNPEFEADDFLCSYALHAEKEGYRVSIVSGDRDLLQLASDTITIIVPHKGMREAQYLGPTDIYDTYGIRPDQVTDYKGLTGDSSDNLPGVRGIGPKTASKLLAEYETLDNLYLHIDDLNENVGQMLEHGKEQAFFCKKMSELVCDIPLPLLLPDLILTDIPASSVLTFFSEMEFTLLERRFSELLRSQYGQTIFHIDGESSPSQLHKGTQLSLF